MAYYPPNGSYAQVDMAANVYLDYPYSADTSKTTIQDIMGISASVGGLSLILPDATETGPGFSIAFSNIGANAVSIKLNDGATELTSLVPAAGISITLTDSTTANGVWLIMPLGNGVQAINTFTIESPNESIDVTNGTVTVPSGTVSIDVSNVINKLNVLSTAAESGIVIYNNNDQDHWYVNLIAGGSNINVSNGNGAYSNPIAINLDNNIEVISILAGNVNINTNQITNTANNEDLVIGSTGTSYTIINGVKIDTSGNISNIASLSALTAFIGPNIPKAWCRFTNTSGTLHLGDNYNVSGVVYDSLNHQYTISFTTAIGATDYGVNISCANNNSTPPLQTRVGYDVVRTPETVAIVLADLSGEILADFPEGVTVTIYSST